MDETDNKKQLYVAGFAVPTGIVVLGWLMSWGMMAYNFNAVWFAIVMSALALFFAVFFLIYIPHRDGNYEKEMEIDAAQTTLFEGKILHDMRELMKNLRKGATGSTQIKLLLDGLQVYFALGDLKHATAKQFNAVLLGMSITDIYEDDITVTIWLDKKDRQVGVQIVDGDVLWRSLTHIPPKKRMAQQVVESIPTPPVATAEIVEETALEDLVPEIDAE